MGGIARGVALWVLLAVGCREPNPVYMGARSSDSAAAEPGDAGAVVGAIDGGTRDAPGTVTRDTADTMVACTPTTTFIGHWSFDETMGTTAHDSSCAGNDGTLVGYPGSGWRQGKVGGALELDGATQWVKVPDVNDRLDAIVATNQLTLAAWVLRKGLASGWASLIGRQYQDTPQEHYALGFIDSADSGTVRVPAFGVNSYDKMGKPGRSCSASVEPPLNQWIHLAGTYDGAVGRLYVDGVEVCSFNYQGSFVPETNPLFMGANNNMAAETLTEWLTGLIDEALFYSRALSAAEIRGLATGGPPPGQ